MKKTCAFLLLTAAIFVNISCGEVTIPNDSQVTTESLSEVVTETTDPISLALPERDYEGYEFKILTTDEVGSVRYSYEIDADTMNGEAMNDAVFMRNQLVEERFNVVITQIPYDKSTFSQAFKNSVLAADDAYDVYVDTYENIMQLGYGYGLEVTSLPYIDLTQSWWDGDIIRESALGGKTYGLLGDINVIDNNAAYCIFFNKRIAEENNIGDIYEIVRSGNWTIDELTRCCKLVANDINGDSVMDYTDQWGMVASGNIALSFMWSCGGKFGEINSGGEVDFTLDTETNINALNKVYEFYSQNDIVLDVTKIPAVESIGTNWQVQRSVFNNGRALFIGSTIQNVDYFRDMEDEFGIIPNPKYDSSQPEYLTSAQEWMATMFMVPKTATNPERTSIILEAMASSAQSMITPVYYDSVLKRKLARDDESSEMLDIIYDSRVFDIVYTYNWGNIRNLSNIIVKDSNTIASTIASMKNSVLSAYEKTHENIINSES